MTKRQLAAKSESWPIAGSFRISRGVKTAAEVVVVEITEDGVTGRGECVPYARYEESIRSVLGQISSVRDFIADGLTRDGLLTVMPSGAARNAVDCALWDLEAKLSGKTIAEIGGIPALGPTITAYTLSLDSPENMAIAAKKHSNRPLFKLKLAGEGDLERVAAVRNAAPRTRLIVDANEAWTADMMREYCPKMADLGVELIEQPLPAGEDSVLSDIERPVPICADESAHDTATLDDVVELYDYINIKLDKTGGLTEALLLAEAAREFGLGVMVGCMLGTSLGMAPAMYLASYARFVDLDGPLLLEKDREHGIQFDGNVMYPPSRKLWG
ncbi:N-acetyl-D-Glu racemase DgcA [uncultured Sneathiella sp.]|uniref:N-acetyl-D-Glu racemase DgcA n=1 Tax=uncultured Sneathiella sp. TaxID=879315 RepID=UPI00259300BF|nr:N-acetyl-D-Glu racemase DgcA [uncultured Sneathiella sp.]